jgi:hypothetical protein
LTSSSKLSEVLLPTMLSKPWTISNVSRKGKGRL